jgi:hypothetical protein
MRKFLLQEFKFFFFSTRGWIDRWIKLSQDFFTLVFMVQCFFCFELFAKGAYMYVFSVCRASKSLSSGSEVNKR